MQLHKLLCSMERGGGSYSMDLVTDRDFELILPFFLSASIGFEKPEAINNIF